MNRPSKRAASPASSPIALLTDFGTRDHYVGTVKGVILSLNPKARIVDISHDVEPQEVGQAGYLLWASYRHFPPRTTFMAVVDPGVGTMRRILVVKANRQYFLAPDNGLLDAVLTDEEIEEAVSVDITNRNRLLSPDISSTFHGRDVFAPVAAHLSMSVPLKKFGAPAVVRKPTSPFLGSYRKGHPKVLHIDRFGNIVTNVRFESQPHAERSIRALSVRRQRVAQWARTYGDAAERTPVLILGSSGLVEIVVKNSSAASMLRVTVGSSMKAEWGR
jgi:S-adenosylmethionine hydrolase